MVITFDELREIKHKLPTGSIKKIAEALQVDEQTVRNYFGAHKYEDGKPPTDWHHEPGPNGGLVHIVDTTILDMAKQMISEASDHVN
ncbi:MAG: DNA-binding protein [Saprospiraceae bacterium]|nr:DNA-binding protein [Saprospiraceae bacterium]